jgi:hypothetical protein
MVAVGSMRFGVVAERTGRVVREWERGTWAWRELTRQQSCSLQRVLELFRRNTVLLMQGCE